MQTVGEYLRRASECEELARNAASDDYRAILTDMAAMWRGLARLRETALSLGKVPARFPNEHDRRTPSSPGRWLVPVIVVGIVFRWILHWLF